MGKKIIHVLLVVFFAISLALALPAQPVQAVFLEEADLTGSGFTGQGDLFGSSVAVSVNTTVVVSPGWGFKPVPNSPGASYNSEEGKADVFPCASAPNGILLKGSPPVTVRILTILDPP